MTNYTKWMISLVVLMLAVTIFVIWVIQDRFFDSDELTVDEATKKIETLYGGTVESFEENEDIFYMSFEKNNETYHLQVDAETGNVLSLNKAFVNTEPNTNKMIKTEQEIRKLLSSQTIGAIQSITFQNDGDNPQYVVEITEHERLKTLIMNGITGEIISENVKDQKAHSDTSIVITSEDAKQIALSQLDGTVEYIVYEESSDGGYYLVEIDGDNAEKTFQIHAISGKILSVSQHDDDLNDDLEDDSADESDNEED